MQVTARVFYLIEECELKHARQHEADEVTHISGSSDAYSFRFTRGVSGDKDANVVKMRARSCMCDTCRGGDTPNAPSCPSASYVGEWQEKTSICIKEKNAKERTADETGLALARQLGRLHPNSERFVALRLVD
jgi:hypothetical protein